MQELFIVNYQSPGCNPVHSITRLPRAEAFRLAQDLASAKTGRDMGRFADFANYYPLRLRTERWLYESFLNLGGAPETEHPLYFVLQGSEFLKLWFGDGAVTRLPLAAVRSDHISFTFGDSAATMDSPERKPVFRKDSLMAHIQAFGGDVDRFLEDIRAQYTYIEAQLWSDCYLTQDKRS